MSTVDYSDVFNNRIKRGRPHKKDPKKIIVKTRFSNADFEKLKFCAERYGLSMAAVIRKGIDELYSAEKGWRHESTVR